MLRNWLLPLAVTVLVDVRLVVIRRVAYGYALLNISMQ